MLSASIAGRLDLTGQDLDVHPQGRGNISPRSVPKLVLGMHCDRRDSCESADGRRRIVLAYVGSQIDPALSSAQMAGLAREQLNILDPLAGCL